MTAADSCGLCKAAIYSSAGSPLLACRGCPLQQAGLQPPSLGECAEGAQYCPCSATAQQGSPGPLLLPLGGTREAAATFCLLQAWLHTSDRSCTLACVPIVMNPAQSGWRWRQAAHPALQQTTCREHSGSREVEISRAVRGEEPGHGVSHHCACSFLLPTAVDTAPPAEARQVWGFLSLTLWLGCGCKANSALGESLTERCSH